MPLPSPRVTVSRVSPADGEPRSCPERHTRVWERSLVLVHGILPTSNGLLPVLVRWVTTTVLPSTTRSTVLARARTRRTPPPTSMLSTSRSHQWVALSATVRSRTTSFSSRAPFQVSRSESSLSENPCSLTHPARHLRRSSSNGSTLLPSSVTVHTRLLRRRDSSWVRSRRILLLLRKDLGLVKDNGS